VIAQSYGTLGIRTSDGSIVEVLDFLKPAEMVTVFTTTSDLQNRARFDFYFQDAPRRPWVYVDSLSLNGIPPAQAGEPDLRIQARFDGKGNLTFGVEDPASGNPRVFAVDAETLHRHCRRLRTGSASGPVPASDSRRSRIEGSSAQVGQRRRRGRFGWIALILFVPVLVLVVILTGPKLLSPEREAAKSADKHGVKSTAESESREAVFSGTSAPASGSRMKPLSKVPATTVEPRVHAGSVVEQSRQEESLPVEIEQDWYRITWGDTLWRIAERFYGDRDLYPELAESNGLPDPDDITAGKTIRLPPAIRGKERKMREEEPNE